MCGRMDESRIEIELSINRRLPFCLLTPLLPGAIGPPLWCSESTVLDEVASGACVGGGKEGTNRIKPSIDNRLASRLLTLLLPEAVDPPLPLINEVLFNACVKGWKEGRNE